MAEREREQILHIESVGEYNAQLGIETLHPLVSVIDMSEVSPIRHQRQTFGFYAIFLKEVKCGDLLYGRHHYDYQEGTLVCLAPGQVIGVEDNGEKFQPKGWALVFHPDLIRGTSLARNMKEYSFFSYEVNEALHLSERERELVIDSLRKIRNELEHAIDRHSRRLIAINIEMLLDYCLRFYERQFITRQHVNHDVLSRFERLLDDYFTGDRARREGLPTVKYFAGELCLSPNYFGDLVKRETGKTAQEYIQLKLVEAAKELMLARGAASARWPMRWDSNIRSTSRASSRRLPARPPTSTARSRAERRGATGGHRSTPTSPYRDTEAQHRSANICLPPHGATSGLRQRLLRTARAASYGRTTRYRLFDFDFGFPAGRLSAAGRDFLRTDHPKRPRLRPRAKYSPCE